MPDSDRFALVKVEGAVAVVDKALDAAFWAWTRSGGPDHGLPLARYQREHVLAALGLDHTDWPTRAQWEDAASYAVDEGDGEAIEQALQRAGGQDG